MTSEIHYILVAQDTRPLCNYSKSDSEYQTFTEGILKEVKSGKSILLYKK